MQEQKLSAAEALEKLKEGNQRFLKAETNPGDVSPAIRQHTCENGQSPYATVITCSDSRVIPEAVFCAGIGELFTIRVAGNVMDHHQLGYQVPKKELHKLIMKTRLMLWQYIKED